MSFERLNKPLVARLQRAGLPRSYGRLLERCVQTLARCCGAMLRGLVNLVTFALAVATLTLALAGAAIYFGIIDVSGRASTPEAMRLLLDFAVHRAVSRSAQDITPPALDHIAGVARGAVRYARTCEACHRAPGAARIDVAQALSPPPADLSLTARRWTPAELFWIIKYGLRMSAMPAWGEVYSDAEIWEIVSVVTRLPAMSPAEYRELQRTGAEP